MSKPPVNPCPQTHPHQAHRSPMGSQCPGVGEPVRTRNRASAKSAGTRFETAVVTFLADHVDDRIERRRQSGSKDRGDVSGWRFGGLRIVAEVKDYGGRYLLGPWLREAEIERTNDDAGVALVVIKRRGTTDPGDQVIAMTLRDLVALLVGVRP